MIKAAILIALLAMSSRTAPDHPEAPRRPQARQATPTALPVAGRPLSGKASWYRWRPGEAAAGPALRRALGARWRGSIVYVNGIPVRLTDWCQCYAGEARERVIDLDVGTFARIVHPSRGVVLVTLIY